jgi:hypothetical protein
VIPCFVFALVSTNITLWFRAFSMPSLALTTLRERSPPFVRQVQLVPHQSYHDLVSSALVHVFDPPVGVFKTGLI